MQPYRLEMGAKLSVGEAANLYQFWRDRVMTIINQALIEDEDAVLVNLASAEYSRVVDSRKLQGNLVTISFKQMYKDTYRTIPIHSKRARGLMIHYAILNRINEAHKLKGFVMDGYSFNEEKSSVKEWVFLREK